MGRERFPTFGEELALIGYCGIGFQASVALLC